MRVRNRDDLSIASGDTTAKNILRFNKLRIFSVIDQRSFPRGKVCAIKAFVLAHFKESMVKKLFQVLQNA